MKAMRDRFSLERARNHRHIHGNGDTEKCISKADTPRKLSFELLDDLVRENKRLHRYGITQFSYLTLFILLFITNFLLRIYFENFSRILKKYYFYSLLFIYEELSGRYSYFTHSSFYIIIFM